MGQGSEAGFAARYPALNPVSQVTAPHLRPCPVARLDVAQTI